MKLVALQNITHDGFPYAPGDRFTASPDEGQALIDAGAAEAAPAPPPPLTESEPDPETE
jgi:hypothetical protein